MDDIFNDIIIPPDPHTTRQRRVSRTHGGTGPYTIPFGTKIGNQRFIVGERLGSGSFGEVYFAVDSITGQKVAAKFEWTINNYCSHPQLLYEAKIMRILSGGEGFPKLYYVGVETDYNVLVSELLGPSLEDLFVWYQRYFSLTTIALLAEQVINRIEYAHNRNILHRDIKPDNFLTSRRPKLSLIYLIDFGLCGRYIRPDHQHIPFRRNMKMTGSARYASMNGHLGHEVSRRDDLEAIGYMLIYFAKGRLPWQGIPGKNLAEKCHRIAEVKVQVSAFQLCEGLPPCFEQYLSYVRNLEFRETPDYEVLRYFFRSLLMPGCIPVFAWCVLFEPFRSKYKHLLASEYKYERELRHVYCVKNQQEGSDDSSSNYHSSLLSLLSPEDHHNLKSTHQRFIEDDFDDGLSETTEVLRFVKKSRCQDENNDFLDDDDQAHLKPIVRHSSTALGDEGYQGDSVGDMFNEAPVGHRRSTADRKLAHKLRVFRMQDVGGPTVDDVVMAVSLSENRLTPSNIRAKAQLIANAGGEQTTEGDLTFASMLRKSYVSRQKATHQKLSNVANAVDSQLLIQTVDPVTYPKDKRHRKHHTTKSSKFPLKIRKLKFDRLGRLLSKGTTPSGSIADSKNDASDKRREEIERKMKIREQRRREGRGEQFLAKKKIEQFSKSQKNYGPPRLSHLRGIAPVVSSADAILQTDAYAERKLADTDNMLGPRMITRQTQTADVESGPDRERHRHHKKIYQSQDIQDLYRTHRRLFLQNRSQLDFARAFRQHNFPIDPEENSHFARSHVLESSYPRGKGYVFSLPSSNSGDPNQELIDSRQGKSAQPSKFKVQKTLGGQRVRAVRNVRYYEDSKKDNRVKYSKLSKLYRGDYDNDSSNRRSARQNFFMGVASSNPSDTRSVVQNNQRNRPTLPLTGGSGGSDQRRDDRSSGTGPGESAQTNSTKLRSLGDSGVSDRSLARLDEERRIRGERDSLIKVTGSDFSEVDRVRVSDNSINTTRKKEKGFSFFQCFKCQADRSQSS